MRLIFFGTSDFALPTLKALIEHGFMPMAVATQPDRPRGRGAKLTPPPVKQFAESNQIKVYQPLKARAKDFVAEMKLLRPEVILVAAYGQILPVEILQIPPYGCINLHPSLLPKYRGAAPIQRAIINQEIMTGATIMLMDEGADTGDIILQQQEKILKDDNSLTLSRRLSSLGAELMLKTLNIIANSNSMPPHFPQSESETEASYAPKLEKEDGQIDWSLPATKVEAIIRGTFPWPGAYTHFRESPLKIVQARAEGEALRRKATKVKVLEPIEPGVILSINNVDGGIVVATGLGDLVINRVHPANRNEVSARDFVNGYRVKVGERLGTN